MSALPASAVEDGLALGGDIDDEGPGERCNEQTSNSVIAASACLETINTVLQTVRERQELFPQIAAALLPLFATILSSDIMIMGV